MQREYSNADRVQQASVWSALVQFGMILQPESRGAVLRSSERMRTVMLTVQSCQASLTLGGA